MSSPTACNNYNVPSEDETYTAAGTYSDIIPNAAGCDSVITINLTINNSSAGAISPTACDSYTAPSGAVYTASGTYTDVIPNATGCDSTITINLTVNTVDASVTQKVTTLTANATGQPTNE